MISVMLAISQSDMHYNKNIFCERDFIEKSAKKLQLIT